MNEPEVTLLVQPGLPGICDASLAARLRRCGAEVRELDAAAIAASGIPAGIFASAHGADYPLDIEAAIEAFCAGGGGLLLSGGTPFGRPWKRGADGAWEAVRRTVADLRDPTGAGALDAEIDLLPAKLGLNSYVPAEDLAGTTLRWDEALLPGAAPLPPPADAAGLWVANTLRVQTARPELEHRDHRAYMAKPVVRRVHAAGPAVDPSGRALANLLVLVAHSGNPYAVDGPVPRPWALASVPVDDAVLAVMWRWCAAPCRLRPITVDQPTIYDGESARFSVTTDTPLPPGWRLRARPGRLSAAGLRAGEAVAWGEATALDPCLVQPRRDGALLLALRVELLDAEGHLRDRAEQAVVQWDEALVRGFPRLLPDGRYWRLERDGATVAATFAHGANWQDRERFLLHWRDPACLDLAADARALAADGAVLVRPHWAAPGWFRQSPGPVYAGTPYAALYQRSPAAAPDERDLRAFAATVAVFGVCGLVLMPTVFTNVGTDCGDPGQWMGTTRTIQSPACRAGQRAVAAALIGRFGHCPNLVWDLINEHDTALPEAGAWLADSRAQWSGGGHAVGIGTFNAVHSLQLGEAADWHSIHSPGCRVAEGFRSGRPCLLQEAWVPTPSSAAGERDLAAVLDRTFAMAIRHGASGVLPWNWSQLMGDWRHRTNFVEYWDLELGACVHPDGTPRRGRAVCARWQRLCAGLSLDQSLDRQVALVLPARVHDGRGLGEYAEWLTAAGIPFRALGDDEIAGGCDLAGLRLAVLPHAAWGFRRATWERLRAHAAASGAELWCQVGSAACDETGQRDPRREELLPGSREALGRGACHWRLWSEGEDAAFAAVLGRLELQRPPAGVIPLRDGGLRWTEVHSTSERTMATDWAPNAKLPDRLVVRRLEVVDRAGVLQRAWVGDGTALRLGPWTVQGEGGWTGLLLPDGSLRLAGTAFTFAGPRPRLRLTAWDALAGERDLGRVSAGGDPAGWTVALPGWGRQHWLAVGG